ncbi:MAG: putative DNA-binding domain-containing protein [Cellvibrio sp.]|nr:putative DNA-binding domain-containing protein [Cellvibrio sp.]
MIKSFQKTQFEFTQYLRDPESLGLPGNIQPERMQVYVELIYNNIEGFISGAFPVLRSIIPDESWHGLVRDFIKTHESQTPYFLQISQEFLTFLLQHSHPLVKDYPFMIALAHYEWVELALDVSEGELPASTPWPEALLNSRVSVSPLSIILSYPWPVHHLSPRVTPNTEIETHLLVYRNRQDQVQFMELNATSSRLLQLCRDNASVSLDQHLNQLHQEGLEETLDNASLERFFRGLHLSDLVFFDLS